MVRWILLVALAALLWFLLTRNAGAALSNAPSDPGPDGGPLDGSYNPGAAQLDGPLNDFAQAVYQFEGGRDTDSLNVRNNNPGNVKSGPGQTGTSGGYATFASFADGWSALQQLITKRAAQHPDWDFYDFFSSYAPASDNNDPNAYAEYVANYAGADPAQTVSSFLQGS
jgi:hypothetical protein